MIYTLPVVSTDTYSDDPPPKESTSRFKFFTDILGSRQITSASSSTPKRSHTINIPVVASLKRSTTTTTSFIRSRGKHLTKFGRSKEPSHDDENQKSSPVIKHRRISSSPVTVRRSATSSATTRTRGMVNPRAEPEDGGLSTTAGG